MLYHRIDSQWISLHFVGNCTVLICKWMSLPVFLELHCTVLHSNVKSAFHLCKRREWATVCSSHAQITATRFYCIELQPFELCDTELLRIALSCTALDCIAQNWAALQGLPALHARITVLYESLLSFLFWYTVNDFQICFFQSCPFSGAFHYIF